MVISSAPLPNWRVLYFYPSLHVQGWLGNLDCIPPDGHWLGASLFIYGLFGCGEKMRRKKMGRKKMKRKENEGKSIFSLLLFGWEENKKKENDNFFFLLFGYIESWKERKCNDIK